MTHSILVSRRERRALALLLGLAVTGHLLRAIAATPARAAAQVDLFDQAGDGNPLAHRDSIRSLARPLGADERVDVDRATVEELERLPGVGPALAKRIVADRLKRGAFGTIQGLDRVPGVGPAVLARLAPHLTFSGVPAEAPRTAKAGQLDLNRATVAELDALPGIGLVRARAIVAFRDSAGPFRQLEDLRRVPGLPGALVRRLADLVVVQ